VQTDILKRLDPQEVGLELKMARQRKGLRQEDVAQTLEVARTTIVAIEKGERRVTGVELVKLAQLYGCQISDFVRQRPKFDPVSVQFRGPETLTEEDREQIDKSINELLDLARNYVELETWLKAPLLRKYPAEYNPKGPIELVAENIAQEERQRLALGEGPIHNLRDVLEQYVGLRIFYLPLPAKFSEIYLYDENSGGCIAVNAEHPWDRGRLSLAHGYLHFLAHRRATEVGMDKVEKRYLLPEEQLANAFARFFLLPTSSLQRRFHDVKQATGNFTVTDLLTVAHLYGVSVEAVTRRLEEMKLLAKGTWDSLKKRSFPIRKYQGELGLKPLQETLLPQRYQILAAKAYEDGLIGRGLLASFLRLEQFEAHELAETLLEASEALPEEEPELACKEHL